MPTYNLYFLGETRLVEGWQSMDFGSDTSALTEATALMKSRAVMGVEVTEGGRLVGMVMANMRVSTSGRE
jgi:hypothetical protein